MRSRRKPAPPRRSRVITTRLAAVSLVIGLVLAVASVPVGVAITGAAVFPAGRETSIQYISPASGLNSGTRSWFLGEDVWFWREEVFEDPGRLQYSSLRNLVRDDPRPPRVARLLDTERGYVVVARAGMPFRAAHGLEHVSMRALVAGTRPPMSTGSTHGLLTFRAGGVELTIPYLPLWFGVLGNTLFYAVLVLTPVALWRWRRFRRRKRRGLCVACAYELGPVVERGVNACPECGLAASS